MLTSAGLVLALAAGAALIALWIDVRWCSAAPRGPGMRIFHACAALVIAQYAAPELMAALLPPGRSVTLEMTALFAIVLPALIYVFVSAIWMLKLLQRVLQPYL